MILYSSMRTDIPAFYSDWFYNRIADGRVLVRNPYYPQHVSQYRLTPDVVDIFYCLTKNPEPMLSRLDRLKAFRTFWHITLTPYQRDIEPNVPDKQDTIRAFKALSRRVGPDCVEWQYDPIFVTGQYNVAYHIDAFERLASALEGATHRCVINFIDLYQKVRKNFPEVTPITASQRQAISAAIAKSCRAHGMIPCACASNGDLAAVGFDCSGCMTKEKVERLYHEAIDPPASRIGAGTGALAGCPCITGYDIGAYNTCPHGCRYCYANYDLETVRNNYRKHDPAAPFLIGGSLPDDILHDAHHTSWMTGQLTLF